MEQNDWWEFRCLLTPFNGFSLYWITIRYLRSLQEIFRGRCKEMTRYMWNECSFGANSAGWTCRRRCHCNVDCGWQSRTQQNWCPRKVLIRNSSVVFVIWCKSKNDYSLKREKAKRQRTHAWESPSKLHPSLLCLQSVRGFVEQLKQERLIIEINILRDVMFFKKVSPHLVTSSFRWTLFSMFLFTYDESVDSCRIKTISNDSTK